MFGSTSELFLPFLQISPKIIDLFTFKRMDSFLLLHPWLKLHPELTDNDLSLLRMQRFEKADFWAKEVAQQLTAHTVLVFLI